MRVAIVHDFLNQRGGAERVAAALTRIFPGAPVYTSFYDPEATFDDFRSVDVRTTFLQKLPHTEAAFRALLPLYPMAFRSIGLEGYDLVVSSSTHWGHHVRPQRALHVVYCHNPPRWLYQTDEYLGAGGPAPGWARPVLAPALAVLKRLDLQAASRPDLYIANSKLVAGRIAALYGREAPVVNPPVDVDRFLGLAARKGGEKSYHLVVGRLLPYKRIDLAIEACASIGRPLVIVGEGPARAELERLAGARADVRFAGKVSDQELLDLYEGAISLIQCGLEDFGIAPLEANAAGIPVVALRNGGALETVIHGVTGILFPKQKGGDVQQALLQVESRAWDADALRRHAASFDETSFERALLRVIEQAAGRAVR